MTDSAVLRFADWTIGIDRSGGVSGTIYELKCRTCGEASDAGEERTKPEDWALRHTGSSPDHRGYQATVTTFFRVNPAPGNPYAERQAGT